MKSILVFFVLIIILFSFGCNTKSTKEETKSYEPTWESLAGHEPAPEWFKDAKFGIYFHWGVYTVPAYGTEWYPRLMFIKGTNEYQHHVETYGHPTEFGYHDFVPDFKAENFDATEWAALFKKAGARFAGPVAEHHDGFSMWDSDVTPWNAGDMGPKRDITGELKEAITNEGMKFITTFHHARHLQRYTDQPYTETDENPDWNIHWNSHYPYITGYPTTSEDSVLKYLYGNIPEEEWLENVWLGKLKEVAEKYQPDIMWFDSWLDEIPESYRQKFAAYYLNQAEKWNKEVVIVRKQDDLPLTFSVDDLEKSRKRDIDTAAWMTDETISMGSWCYTENLDVKPAADLIHVLADIVSKNGVLLLNVSPMSNGVIPENQKQVLLEMGDWIKQNGEAIYGTRPWYIYGEGPTTQPEGSFENHQDFLKVKYSEKDIRYTTKDDVLYAIILGKPVDQVVMREFANQLAENQLEVATISLVGSDASVNWNYTEDDFIIDVPSADLDEMANVFKIVFK
ncbi:MAG: alpha-L-fucosidase [Bacteroidota bacterium]